MPDQSAPHQLGNGYTAYPTVDGHGRTNGWAIYDPAGEYIDTAYNLAGAVEFTKGYAEHQAQSAPAAAPQQVQPKAWVQKGISPAMMSFHWGMTALTCGLWSPVLILALIRGKRRMVPRY